MQILLVGCGKMGEAILSGMLQSRSFSQNEVSVIHPHSLTGIHKTKERFGVKVYTSYPKGMKFDVVLFAVKPQTLPEILPYYDVVLAKHDTLIISIAAGKTTTYFSNFFPDKAIIRTMPNINALVCHAATVGYTNKQLNSAQKSLVEKIFSSIGSFTWIPDERLIDAVTAIAGSGPAYFFQFIEYMVEAGIDIGLPSELASNLAIQTFIGSATLLEQSGQSVTDLRNAVTSPNGTTAAALDIFNNGDTLKSLIKAAMHAAHKRSTELAQ